MWKTYEQAVAAMKRDGWKLFRGLYLFCKPGGSGMLFCELEYEAGFYFGGEVC